MEETVEAEVVLTERQRYWLDHLQACASLNISILEYCKTHEINSYAMYAGKKKLIEKGALPQAHPPRFQRAQVVEDLELGLVSIDGEGKAVLDGIYFDSGKSVVKPESSSTLGVISKYLGSHSKARFYVVGHTDNNGSYEYNLNLSRNRASAVVATMRKNTP